MTALGATLFCPPGTKRKGDAISHMLTANSSQAIVSSHDALHLQGVLFRRTAVRGGAPP